MADFFKGLAGGMQTGLQFGRAMQERQERERLREAMGLTPQEIAPRPPTEDELNRAIAETEKRAADDARMFATESSLENRTGLYSSNPAERPLDASFAPQMPYVGQKVGGTQYRLGDQTLNRMPTQQEIEAARYAAAANVLAERDPVAAARMRQEQVRMQRENELFPLQKQQLEGQLAGQAQQRDLVGLQLDEGKRTAAQRQNYDNFTAFAAKNPDMPVAELKENAFKQFNFTPKQWQETVATRLQIETGEMDSFKNSIKKKLQGKNLNQLGELYNSDPDFDDKTDLAIVPGKNGAVTLNFINKDSKSITESQTFKSQALAIEYLNKQATEPETIGSWMMNLQKAEVGLDKDRAAIRASDATVRYRDQQGKALDAAKGLTQKQEDYQRALDGVFEGYQSAMALGPQGRQAAAIYAREYDQLRANVPKGLRAPPSIASMNEAQRAEKPEKPVKVEDAGVQYKVGGKLMQTDGRGNLISAKGILPDDRPTVLKTVGISDNNASRLVWSDDGETVMFNNEEFDIRDKRDVEKLNKMLKDYDVMNRTIAEEARLRANPTSPSGFQGARTTGIGPASTYGVAPGAQSIYGR